MGIGGGGAKPPPPPDPVPIPDLEDPAILATRRRKLDDVMSRSGRASTQLTDNPYSGDKLGLR